MWKNPQKTGLQNQRTSRHPGTGHRVNYTSEHPRATCTAASIAHNPAPMAADSDPPHKPASASDTPIMKQYQAAKARYPNALLFFRIGDFYELFYDDAKTISRVLGLTLTSRNKGPDPIPMAGVPAHAAEPYLARLLRQGFSVAVCDQTEDASQAKGLVKRDVTRVVTPGTVLDENLLEARKPNRLVAILPAGSSHAGAAAAQRFGVAAADLTSGSIHIQELQGDGALRAELARLSPTECVVPEEPPAANGKPGPSPFPPALFDGIAVSRLKPDAFDPREAHERVVARFSDSGRDKESAAALKKLAKDHPLALSAAGALTGYIDETCGGGKLFLSPPQLFDPAKFLALGDAVIRSLELTETLRNRSFEGSLLWSIDRTCTPGGGRILREWLIRPLRELEPLRARHDAVGALAEDFNRRGEIRAALKTLADLERISARLAAGRATPRDLLALRDTLQSLPALHDLLDQLSRREGGGILPAGTDVVREDEFERHGGALLPGIGKSLSGLNPVAETIAAELRDDCSNVLTEGGLMKDGVDAELDRLRAISSGGREWIAKFQADEAARSGISSLKVGYNRVFGYYIEISRANQKLVPADYERRQTLTNAERFTTPALKEREAEVLGAEEKIGVLEQKLFLKLRERIADYSACLHTAGRALAALDALCSLAEVAHKRNHVRPLMTPNGRLRFDQMRHPVLEETLPRGDLVPNDIALCSGGAALAAGKSGKESGKSNRASGKTENDPQIILLTGPNMAGKSTYIRSTALCTILAQMGGFVPAEKAEVGLVDRIFTRVGAADDLAGGRSTFMVEMTEMAEILSSCSDQSLVILDEVGRGTSTYDGVSLAWSLVEHLHQGPAKPRTLFATHYHELSALEDELPRVKNASASVKEWQGEITFLHSIVPGPSERSFGIHVARLAGLPKSLLQRAKDILTELEKDGQERVEHLTGGARGNEWFETTKAKLSDRGGKKSSGPGGQMSLFEPFEADPKSKALLDQLRKLDPHAVTPIEALTLLNELVSKAREIRP